MTLNLTLSNNVTDNPHLLSPLTLAFIGDAVFDLMMREYYIRQANRPVRKLHSLSASKVCAKSQAEAVRKIHDMLTDEEADILRRGRNAHTSHTPKNSTQEDYHLATGLEALFGFLYLSGHTGRLNELFTLITDTYLDECK